MSACTQEKYTVLKTNSHVVVDPAINPGEGHKMILKHEILPSKSSH